MRTRIMNQLQALAMNEGRRWKTKLWSVQGRAELEKLALPPWAGRRRKELLELLDRLDPIVGELTKAAEKELCRAARGRSRKYQGHGAESYDRRGSGPNRDEEARHQIAFAITASCQYGTESIARICIPPSFLRREW
jgi:hypothetical protein